MDAVCIKGSWDLVMCKDGNGKLEGALVFHIRKYRGFTLLLMPPLTSYSGIYYNYPQNLKRHSKTSFEIRVANNLLEQLPKHDLIYLQLHPSITNGLPFYWKNFHQSTRYTYKIDTSQETDILWENLKGNVRTNIRNSEEACIIESSNLEAFWRHCVAAYAARNRVVPFNRQVLENLSTAFKASDNLEIKLVKSSSDDKVLGGAITVSDQNTRYYLAGFYYPNTSPKYAFSYLLWHIIKNNPQKSFDMEGSIIPEIEHFFRSFGGDLTPHFKVWKVNNILLRWLFKLKTPSFLK
ncbi:MAG: GNAT family N-acetyltransferase [Saprospiraceae bacterium]|nr:GNAT family N-acetyltransferase [Saprospiraceae bacterium]